MIQEDYSNEGFSQMASNKNSIRLKPEDIPSGFDSMPADSEDFHKSEIIRDFSKNVPNDMILLQQTNFAKQIAKTR